MTTTEPTNLVTGIEAAHTMLRKSSKRGRRILVVTDRQPASSVQSAIAKLRADNIVLSVIAIDHNPAELAAIAKAGNGRLYAVEGQSAIAPAMQKELDRSPLGEEVRAYAFVIDRSLWSRLEHAKLEMQSRVAALSSRDFVTVIAFDTVATMHVRPQLAANRMRISHQITRISPEPGGNTDVGLQMAFAALEPIAADEKHVVLFGVGGNAELDFVKRIAAVDVIVSAVGFKESHREALDKIVTTGKGKLQLLTDRDLKMR